MSDTLTKIGRYEIRGTLGAGAMGIVYRGWDTRLEQEVAVKVLIPGSDAANHPEEIKRFLREVKISRTLKHPNIVSVYDVDDDSATGRTFIVMELVNGRPLDALLKEKALTFQQIVGLIGQVADGLDYAAHKGVVHRDIKPANILVDPETLTPKIVDFGVARLESPNATQTQTIIGTPYYMSPEQWRGDPVDGRSDLFSLGAVLYEMLTHQKAFPGDSLPVVMSSILDPNTPVPPEQVRPGIIPEALSQAVMKAIAKHPKDRYQRGKDMKKAMEAALSSGLGQTVTIETETVAINRPNVTTGASALKLVAPASAPALKVHTARKAVAEWEEEAGQDDVPRRGRRKLRRVLAMLGLLPVLLGVGWVGWPQVKSALAPPLTLEVGILKQSNGGAITLLQEGDTLLPGDRMAIHVQPSTPAFVYVWLVAPSGRRVRMFPNPGMTQQRNPVDARGSLWLPSPNGERQWLPVKGQHGSIEFVIVATADPLPRLRDPMGLMRLTGKLKKAEAEEQLLSDTTWLKEKLAPAVERGVFVPPPDSALPPVRTLEGNSKGLSYRIRLNLP
jgi:predicted Ser/Thr protein kinase